ncbi:MAG TPA: hypothetical protein VJ783_28270 [Pirellulales bacterium]|nr:hypothetical protein [Pirellulales bacterium]
MRPGRNDFTACILAATLLVGGVLSEIVAADETTGGYERHLAELEELSQKLRSDTLEYVTTHKERTDTFLARLTDAEFLACIRADQRKSPPNEAMAAEFLALAKREPDPRVALPALRLASFNSVDPESPIWEVGRRALDLLLLRHLADRELDQVLKYLHIEFPMVKAEGLLRAALDKSPHREVRAAACYQLACYLNERSKLAETIRQNEEAEDATWRRFWLLVVIPYMKSVTPHPPETYLADHKVMPALDPDKDDSFWPQRFA